MRKHFADIINKKSKVDKSIFLITGDLGFGVLDKFRIENKGNFLNIGICEQTMLSFSAGMSQEFQNTFVYSISNFNTFRPLEQLRNDICYQNNKIILASVGTGFSYGKLGYTHYGIEDIGAVNLMPNIEIYNPLDETQLKFIFPKLLKSKKPIYLRLNRDGNVKINGIKRKCEDGFEKIFFNRKNKTTFISYGYMTKIIYKFLLNNNLFKNYNLIDCYRIKPFNKQKFLELNSNSNKIIVSEEHLSNSGLYSIILNSLNNNKIIKDIYKIGINNQNFTTYGDHDFMIKKYINIEEKIKKFL